MTTLREAAQQALEGLEKWQWDKDPRGADAYITALRAALAQQAEPVEPVAWYYERDTDKGLSFAPDRDPYKCWQPLYTAPPQRKPLTDAEIPALAEQVLKLSVYYDVWALLGTDGLVALVRAVEQAHGIKE